jgi:predicted HTH transcriptional regulator
MGQVSRGLEITFDDLEIHLHVPAETRTLARIIAIQQFLDSRQLEVHPPLGVGNLATVRVLRFKAEPIDQQKLLDDIAAGEGERCEFKGSLYFDHTKAAEEPGKEALHYKREELLLSVLKTICAFLNCDGGRLYVGIGDLGQRLGVDADYPYVGGSTIDDWELHLRDKIKSIFRDGANLNDYVRMQWVQIDGPTIVRLEITPRRNISCLRWKEQGHLVFRRQGNRTTRVEIFEMEEFVRFRDRRWDEKTGI